MCLVQQHIGGKSLLELVRAGRRFSESEAIELGVKLARVLEYLHGFEPPILHRDLKPANVLVTPGERVYLVDFGAVRDHVPHEMLHPSGPTIVGTPGYMPIEQFEGHAVPGSDLYALGATLVFALSGRSRPSSASKACASTSSRTSRSRRGFAGLLARLLEPDWRERPLSALPRSAQSSSASPSRLASAGRPRSHEAHGSARHSWRSSLAAAARHRRSQHSAVARGPAAPRRQGPTRGRSDRGPALAEPPVAGSPPGSVAATRRDGLRRPGAAPGLAPVRDVRLRHGGPVRGLAFTPDGAVDRLRERGRNVSLWSATTGEERRRFALGAKAAALAALAGRLAPARRRGMAVDGAALGAARGAAARAAAAGVGLGGTRRPRSSPSPGRATAGWWPRAPTRRRPLVEGRRAAPAPPRPAAARVAAWPFSSGTGRCSWTAGTAPRACSRPRAAPSAAPEGSRARAAAAGVARRALVAATQPQPSRARRPRDRGRSECLQRRGGPGRATSRPTAFAPDGRRWRSGLGSGKVALFDVATRARVRVLEGPGGPSRRSRSRPTAASSSARRRGHSVSVFDIESGRPLVSGWCASRCGPGLDFSPDGDTLLSAGADGTMRRWDRAGTRDDPGALRPPRLGGRRDLAARACRRGRGGPRPRLRRGERLGGHRARRCRARVAPGRRRRPRARGLARGRRASSLQIVDLASGARRSFPVPRAEEALAFSPDGRVVATLREERSRSRTTLVLRDAATGRELAQLPHNRGGPYPSAAARPTAATSASTAVCGGSATTRRRACSTIGWPGRARLCAVSPDGATWRSRTPTIPTRSRSASACRAALGGRRARARAASCAATAAR